MERTDAVDDNEPVGDGPSRRGHPAMSVPGELLGWLLQYRWVLLPGFFFGFFGLALLAVSADEESPIRRGFLFVVVVLLLGSNLTGIGVLPLVELQKFSIAESENVTYHELRVVDADGNELVYDARAAPPLQGALVRWLARDMATTHTPAVRQRVGRYLLRRARQYRASLRDDSVSMASYVDYPRHVLDHRWPADSVDGTGARAVPHEWSGVSLGSYDRFVAIRVYEVEITSSADGRTITAYSERKVVEVRANDTEPTADVTPTIAAEGSMEGVA